MILNITQSPLKCPQTAGPCQVLENKGVTRYVGKGLLTCFSFFKKW